MKKILYVCLMMLGLFIGFKNVDAATKDDLRKKLDATYDIIPAIKPQKVMLIIF